MPALVFFIARAQDSPVGILVVYCLSTVFLYLAAMYLGPAIVRREERRVGGVPILPRILTAGFVIAMLIDQLGWLQRILSLLAR